MSFWSDDDDDFIEDLTASQWVREPVMQAKVAGSNVKIPSSGTHTASSRSTNTTYSVSLPTDSLVLPSSPPPVPHQDTPAFSSTHTSDPVSEPEPVPITPGTGRKRRSSPAGVTMSARPGRSGGGGGGSPEQQRGQGSLCKRARPSYVYAPVEEELDEDYQPVRRKGGAGRSTPARESARAAAGTGSGVKAKGKGKRVILDSDDEEAVSRGKEKGRGQRKKVLLDSDDEKAMGLMNQAKEKGKPGDVVPGTDDDEDEKMEAVAWEGGLRARRDFVPDTDEEENEPIPSRRDKGKGKARAFVPGTSEEDDFPFQRPPSPSGRYRQQPFSLPVEVVHLLSPNDTSSRRIITADDPVALPSDHDYFDSFPLDLIDMNIPVHPPAAAPNPKAVPEGKRVSPVRAPHHAEPVLDNVLSSPAVPLAASRRHASAPSRRPRLPSRPPPPPSPCSAPLQRFPPLPAPRIYPTPVPAPQNADEFPLQMVSDLPEGLQEFYLNHFRRGAGKVKKTPKVGELVSEDEEEEEGERQRGGGGVGSSSGRGGAQDRWRGRGGTRKAPGRGKWRPFKKSGFRKK